MSHPFGDLLRQYCSRKAGLSKTRLAHVAGYDQAVLSRMSQGKKDLTGPSGRERVVRLIGVLRDEGALTTPDEANALLRAAGMAPLYEGQMAERALLQSLRATPPTAATPAPEPPLELQHSPAVHFSPPAPLTPLVGRKREVAEIAGLLATARLVTLTGTAGSGKTRLALEIAGRLAEAYPHGACFVALAPIQRAGDVVPAVARALGVPVRAGVDVAEVLRQYLANKALLLLLDNYEHVLEAASAVTDWLMSAPGMRVLATSREPLRVSGEHVCFVEPLAVAAAVDLFAQRARAIKPTFALEGVEDSVAEICRRVDCLPLAIELAAATARQYSPRVLLANLRGLGDPGGMDALASGPRDAPDRHRTLRSAIRWSYDLLSADQQRVLRSLGVFAGGAEVDQIAFVVHPAGTQSLISDLQSLVDKNLARVDEQPDGTHRYSMHELIREFALDVLAERGEFEAAQRAHAEAFCALAEAAEPRLHDREQHYWVARLERELHNLRAALSWSLTQAGDARLGLRLAARLWLFWWVGQAYEGIRWLRQALDAAGPDAPAFSRGRALLGYGSLLAYTAGLLDILGFQWAEADFPAELTGKASLDRIKAVLEESMRLLHGVGDEEGVAFALFSLGSVFPQDERIQRLAQESLTPERWRGNRLGLAWAACVYLHNMYFGNAFQQRRDLLEAQTEDVITFATECGDTATLALALFDRSHEELYRDDLPRARTLMEQSLSAARAVGDSWLAVVAIGRLAEILELMGDLEGAQRWLDEWLRMGEQSGWLGMNKWLFPLAILGKLARDRGDYAAARSYFVESLRVSPPDYQWWVLEGLSCVASAQGQYARAARLLGAAEADRLRMNDPWWPKDVRDLAPYIAMARAGLGEEAYAAACAEGRAMVAAGLRVAFAYAMTGE